MASHNGKENPIGIETNRLWINVCVQNVTMEKKTR